MRTLKQTEASRSNGSHSRGPVTPNGKARSKRNSLRHGIRARRTLLDHEDRHAFDQEVSLWQRAMRPQDAVEFELVLDIVDTRWRLARVDMVERERLNSAITARTAASPTGARVQEIEGCLAAVRELGSVIATDGPRPENAWQSLGGGVIRLVGALRSVEEQSATPLRGLDELSEVARRLGTEASPVDSLPKLRLAVLHLGEALATALAEGQTDLGRVGRRVAVETAVGIGGDADGRRLQRYRVALERELRERIATFESVRRLRTPGSSGSFDPVVQKRNGFETGDERDSAAPRGLALPASGLPNQQR